MKNVIRAIILVGAIWLVINYITDLQTEISSLTSTVSVLEVIIEKKDSEIASLYEKTLLQKKEMDQASASIVIYRAQVTDLETKLANYSSQISSLQMQNSNLHKSVATLESDKSTLTTRINRILGTTVIQHYSWLRTYSWELPIPLSLYFEYRDRPRPNSIALYVNMDQGP
jgi:peptidoglycan hydrolase CwlO-like protein